MMLTDLTADEILAIPPTEPEKLFRSFPPNIDHRLLAKRWHPDHGGDGNVLAHINVLWDLAEKKFTRGVWGEQRAIMIDARDGHKFNFLYRKVHSFELGDMAVGMKAVLFMVRRQYEDQFINGVRALGSIKYPDAKMRAEHERFIPTINRVLDTPEHCVMLVHKTEDTVLLRDLIDHLGGAIDPKHTAWVISRLLNIACFYQLSGMTHNGLSVDTVFVSPEYHSAFPIGGWWYSAMAGRTLRFLPPSSHAVAPRKILIAKKADLCLDLECIKAIGRTCLGDPTGADFRLRKDIPRPMAEFLLRPGTGSAFEDYKHWFTKTLPDSFGPRRFIKLAINPSDIYL